MNIITHGKLWIPTDRFTCPTCGCAFEADFDDWYTVNLSKVYDSSGTADLWHSVQALDCPECGSNVRTYRGSWAFPRRYAPTMPEPNMPTASFPPTPDMPTENEEGTEE
jgi:hypothetical protein